MHRHRIPGRWAWPLAVMFAVALPYAAVQAQTLEDLLKQLKAPPTQAAASGLPTSDVAAGLKEALAQGTTHAIKTLGRADGFWGNPAVRIPLPDPLQKTESLLRSLGQGKKVDAFQLSLNRAAERAVPEVADIFGDAIRTMTLDDARAILAGPPDAATQYFRRVAGERLAQRIRPIVADATGRVGVTRKYKALAGGPLGALGGMGGALDLDGYVTDKTLDGLFATIAEQEKEIRRNPAARTSELLRRVFGGR